MIASPVPTSCMACPVEGSSLPTVFYSVFKLVLAGVSTVLEESTVFVPTQMWPEIKVSRVLEGEEHP